MLMDEDRRDYILKIEQKLIDKENEEANKLKK
jgi:hypothetical protein